MDGDALLYISGTGQIALAVLLGWPIAMHQPDNWAGRLFPDRRRLLQSHIDDLMMGTMQIALAASSLAVTGWLAWAIVFGSWINAQLFLFHAIRGAEHKAGNAMRLVTIVSFASLTVAYCVLFVRTAALLI